MPDKYFDLSIVDCIDYVSEKPYIPSQHFFNQVARVSKKTIFFNISELICTRKLLIDSYGLYLFSIFHEEDRNELLNFAITSQNGVQYLGGINHHSILTFASENTIGVPVLERHNIIKPLDLYRIIFSQFCPEALTVFDANILNGNSRIAADMHGKIFYGAGKYPAQIELQEKRFTKYKNSPELPMSW